eukprot:00741.XXX_738_956_1 [CDS] Oithona nana genome sequencing.
MLWLLMKPSLQPSQLPSLTLSLKQMQRSFWSTNFVYLASHSHLGPTYPVLQVHVPLEDLVLVPGNPHPPSIH